MTRQWGALAALMRCAEIKAHLQKPTMHAFGNAVARVRLATCRVEHKVAIRQISENRFQDGKDASGAKETLKSGVIFYLFAKKSVAIVYPLDAPTEDQQRDCARSPSVCSAGSGDRPKSKRHGIAFRLKELAAIQLDETQNPRRGKLKCHVNEF